MTRARSRFRVFSAFVSLFISACSGSDPVKPIPIEPPPPPAPRVAVALRPAKLPTQIPLDRVDYLQLTVVYSNGDTAVAQISDYTLTGAIAPTHSAQVLAIAPTQRTGSIAVSVLAEGLTYSTSIAIAPPVDGYRLVVDDVKYASESKVLARGETVPMAMRLALTNGQTFAIAPADSVRVVASDSGLRASRTSPILPPGGVLSGADTVFVTWVGRGEAPLVVTTSGFGQQRVATIARERLLAASLQVEANIRIGVPGETVPYLVRGQSQADIGSLGPPVLPDSTRVTPSTAASVEAAGRIIRLQQPGLTLVQTFWLNKVDSMWLRILSPTTHTGRVVLKPYVKTAFVTDPPLAPLPPRIVAMMDTVSRVLSHILPRPPVQRYYKDFMWGRGADDDTLPSADIPVRVAMGVLSIGVIGAAQVHYWDPADGKAPYRPTGGMVLDSLKLANAGQVLLFNVILHEAGHAIGLYTVFNDLTGALLQRNVGDQGYGAYMGTRGNAAFHAMPGAPASVLEAPLFNMHADVSMFYGSVMQRSVGNDHQKFTAFEHGALQDIWPDVRPDAFEPMRAGPYGQNLVAAMVAGRTSPAHENDGDVLVTTSSDGPGPRRVRVLQAPPAMRAQLERWQKQDPSILLPPR